MVVLFQSGRDTLVALVQQGGESTTDDLAKATGVANGPQRARLVTLVKQGLVEQTQKGIQGGHRPAIWKITEEGSRYIHKTSPERLSPAPAPTPASSDTTNTTDTVSRAAGEAMQFLHERGPSTVAIISRDRGRKPDTTRKTLLNLVGKGYIEKDGSIWRLTPAGEERLAKGNFRPDGGGAKRNKAELVHTPIARRPPYLSDLIDDEDIVDDLIPVVHGALMVPELRLHARRLMRQLGRKGVFE